MRLSPLKTSCQRHPLYRRFQAGDTAALGELKALYASRVKSRLRGFDISPSDTETLLSDIFTKIMLSRNPFCGDSSFDTYLYAVTKHTAMRYIGQEQRHDHLPLDEETAVTPSIEEEYLRKDENERLHRAVDALPTDYGAAIRLVYFGGLSYAEAGGRMGKTVTQIRGIIQRAKTELKKQLENH